MNTSWIREEKTRIAIANGDLNTAAELEASLQRLETAQKDYASGHLNNTELLRIERQHEEFVNQCRP